MAQDNTLARSLHDVGLAAWFGGSLMGAVGLNGAASARWWWPSGGAAQPPRLPGRRLSHRPTIVVAVRGPRSGAAGKPSLGPLL
jgi:hypothetical protein